MDLDILKYRNLFPSDITDAGAFLLKVMPWLPPLSQNAARLILKPLVCDDCALDTLRNLESKNYIWKRSTAIGNFYAITSKTSRVLDVHRERATHRKQQIELKPLPTNILKSSIAAAALLKCGAVAYLRAWKGTPPEVQAEYLRKQGIRKRDFEWKLAQLNSDTINLLPRSIVNLEAVLAEMADGLITGKIPFTLPYRTRLYQTTNDNFLTNANIYDVGRAAVSKASSRLTKDAAARMTDKELDYLETARQQTEQAKNSCTVLTYLHGAKPLSLATLEDNGIFLTSLKNEIGFGVLNNGNYGLPTDILNARIDYAISFADRLKKEFRISIYTLPENKALTEKRLSRCTILGKARIPDIAWVEVPTKRPPLKSETWKNVLAAVSANEK